MCATMLNALVEASGRSTKKLGFDQLGSMVQFGEDCSAARRPRLFHRKHLSFSVTDILANQSLFFLLCARGSASLPAGRSERSLRLRELFLMVTFGVCRTGLSVDATGAPERRERN